MGNLLYGLKVNSITSSFSKVVDVLLVYKALGKALVADTGD